MTNRKYSDELKEQVVKEYLAGAHLMDLVRKYATCPVKTVS